MRIAMIATLTLLIALPAAAQDPTRRAEVELRMRRALEAQRARVAAQALETERAMLEARLAALADTPDLATQRALLEAQLAKSAAVELHDAKRLRLEALADAGVGPDQAFHAALDRIAERGPAESWAPQDPADSVYEAARRELNRGNYREAVRLFNRISAELRFQNSGYRAAAYYWQAFALARLGSEADLRRARTMLTNLKDEYPRAALIAEAASLGTTIDASLARRGDEGAAENLARALMSEARAADLARAGRPPGTGAPAARQSQQPQQQQCEDDDIRTIALNALVQMESAEVVPILREVMARRDACSAVLRRRAMLMLAQHQTAQAQEILIQAALEDPDPEVREQATFWLSHVPGDAAVDALDRILRGNPPANIEERAVFALGQHASSRASEILRDYALRTDVPEDLRRHIVVALAHSTNAANAGFLRELYGRTSDLELKRQIIVSLSHNATPEHADWLMGIAADADEATDVRRQALMVAAHNHGVATDRLVRLYDETTDEEFRRHIILTFGQRVADDPAAVDALIDVARTTDDAEIQKQVILMLGHSNDPRVAELLAEIIRRPIR
jgi:HEAT repeat protein